MPPPSLQNRVDPFGQFHAVPHRGALMGNRGILHDNARQIRRQWAHKAWVTCLLHYGDVRRTVFAPGTYSELFFLDEATALAAGHRPCATCQRERYLEFKRRWLEANMCERVEAPVPVSEIDAVLHAERAIAGGQKRCFEAVIDDLPIGTMFEWNGQALLCWTRGPMTWSFTGYTHAAAPPSPGTAVSVLTPSSIVLMFMQGYVPHVHPSAGVVA